MAYVETTALKNATIMLLHSERDEIDVSPEYQRMGGVWTPAKRRLLIDSIINDYDIPKLYFHKLDEITRRSSGFKYAVIDGRQRLETIWKFIEGDFTLAPDFEYQRDPSVDLASLGYADIAQQYPKIRIKFDSFVLPIVLVETEGDDLDLIEDMFSRLNEAVPLNAAERRNAFGGNLVSTINYVSGHPYFASRVKFSSTRYKHREVAARFLLLEESLQTERALIDTKREYLDALAVRYKTEDAPHVYNLQNAVESVLALMYNVFVDKDELLSAQGLQSVYYLIFRSAIKSGEINLINRPALLRFRSELARNREKAATDYEKASFEYLEFDRLNQQGTNDATSIRERYQTLCRFLGIRTDEAVVKSG